MAPKRHTRNFQIRLIYERRPGLDLITPYESLHSPQSFAIKIRKVLETLLPASSNSRKPRRSSTTRRGAKARTGRWRSTGRRAQNSDEGLEIWVVVKIMVPFLVTLKNTCRTILGAQKGTLILTTTHLGFQGLRFGVPGMGPQGSSRDSKPFVSVNSK